MTFQRPLAFTDTGVYDGCSVSELLTEIAAEVRGRQASEVREWQAIVAWADENIADTPAEAATVTERFVDTGVPIAGPNAPLVWEFGLMELIAVLGRSPDGGRAYVGRVVGCAWRLPRLYDAVLHGRVAPWKAARVAEQTMRLNREAVEFVDRQLAAAVGGVGLAQLDRLIATAITRFDPALAEAEREDAADGRYFDIGAMDEHGLSHIDGLLDAADGRDLDTALSRRARLRGQLGDDASLDVRRSKAAGDLARGDLELDIEIPDPETGEVIAKSPGRTAVITVHITDTTLTPGPFGKNPVGRWEEGRAPVSTEQIREWLTDATGPIIVRPVIDLADCVPVDAYEIPDRHKTRVRLRDTTCRFPHCTKDAAACDLDHAVPYADGGPTCPRQLVPLCRRHHRAKTHSLWRYTIIEPGHYLWTSPHGHHWHVGPEGTRSLDPPRSLDPDQS